MTGIDHKSLWNDSHTMQEKQILARATEIQKENWG